MNTRGKSAYLSRYSIFLSTLLINLLTGFTHTAFGDAEANPAVLLNTKYVALGNELRNNPFQRPLILDSFESSNNATGEVYALVNHPFETLSTALKVPANWCDILILHQNTKYCKAASDLGSTELRMMIGKKISQPLENAHKVDLGYRLTRSDANYLSIQLTADSGPMGTKNYRVVLEAIPVGSNQTFMHFTYAYSYGLAGGVAMKAYLATVGRHKVGFTPKGEGSKAAYIGGVRGMIERNTMRYYLAIDCYLGALSVPQEQQLNKRLQDWYSATERYPRQLHEITKSAYLAMKRDEVRRMTLM